jgi:HK97 family phage portal protein
VLRTTLQLEAAANRLASTDTPAGILKNRGPDLAPEEVDALLGAWEAGRARRLTGYVNAVLDYERVQFSAADMELNDGRDHQVAEVARLLNLPTSDLNAPTNDSLTYSTVEGQRLDRLNRLRPYLVAVESRFSMPDVTPRGQRTFFDVADYLRADTTARMAAYEVAIRSQVLPPAEARQRENLPPTDAPAALPPGDSQP